MSNFAYLVSQIFSKNYQGITMQLLIMMQKAHFCFEDKLMKSFLLMQVFLEKAILKRKLHL